MKYYRKNENIIHKFFCKALVKRKQTEKNVIYEMVKEHSSLCNKFLVIKKDNESDVILHYNDFILKCNSYLDSQEIYNRKDFTENYKKYKMKINIILI